MNAPVKEKEFYNLREVCLMLGLSSRTANNWLKEGRFTNVHRIGAKGWVFSRNFGVRESSIQGQKIELLRRLVPNDKIECVS